MIRRIAGAALALIAAWLLWEAAGAVQMIVSRGSPLADALLSPPTSAWRLVAGGFALIGGLLAGLRLPFGGILGLLGSLLYIALALALAQLTANGTLMTSDFFAGAAMAVLALVLMFTRRNWVQ